MKRLVVIVVVLVAALVFGGISPDDFARKQRVNKWMLAGWSDKKIAMYIDLPCSVPVDSTTGERLKGQWLLDTGNKMFVMYENGNGVPGKKIYDVESKK